MTPPSRWVEPPRALIFDLYGTLVDTDSVTEACEEAFPGKGSLLSSLWRRKQLEYTWLLNSMGQLPRLLGSLSTGPGSFLRVAGAPIGTSHRALPHGRAPQARSLSRRGPSPVRIGKAGRALGGALQRHAANGRRGGRKRWSRGLALPDHQRRSCKKSTSPTPAFTD